MTTTFCTVYDTDTGMRVLEMTGVVDAYPEWPNTNITIQDMDILEAVGMAFPYREYSRDTHTFTVLFGVHTHRISEQEATGRMDEEPGDQGYSEVTDWEMDTLTIGDMNVTEQLRAHDGQTVTLRIDAVRNPQDS